MPAASRSQSSHAQPCSCTSGARNSDASATRPVITTSGALRERVGDGSRSEVGRREQRRRGHRLELVAGVEMRERLPVIGVQRVEAREHVVAEHGRDLDARHAHRAPCRRRRGRGGVDATGIRDHLRAPVGDEGKCAREVRGKVARIAARLVALTILLEDRERQLGEGLEAEILDAVREQRVDRSRRVAVEPLPAGDADRRHDPLKRAREDDGRPTDVRTPTGPRPAAADPPARTRP